MKTQLTEAQIEKSAGTEILFQLSRAEAVWLINALRDRLADTESGERVALSVLLDKHDIRNGDVRPIISLLHTYKALESFSVIIGGSVITDNTKEEAN